MDNRELDIVLAALGVTEVAGQPASSDDHDHTTQIDGLLTLAAGERKRLGEMLVDVGRAEPEQLMDALAEQARTGEKLGEIAIRRGWLDPGQLDRALRFQDAQSQKCDTKSRLCLGEILVATGEISRAQLDDALARQRDSGRQLGSELVNAGHLKPHQLASGLHLQRRLVALAIAATLAVGTAVETTPAEAAVGANAQVAVSATVLRHVSIRVLSAPHTIHISEADIVRGYVDVPIPLMLEIVSNSPTGYLLTVESQADFARGTEVRGIGSPVSFGRFGGVLSVQSGGHGMQTMPAELNFRVLLSEEARPGVHPWPIQISVMPT
ncbi:conserved protein of unknown function [Georgfuchsia toluolica]|uniref:Uncharacterized protein n=1 Tax=Georgfuchsia toluolica TaxID=424218 RepID=A0A916J694_9PROT|nr:hypothetical protein [Georgfuchsia toluolica]CAG4884717.1 conserved protein of unknown function [Georgfuchsia toluolica]